LKSLGFKLLVMVVMIGVLAYQVDLGQALLRLGTLGYVAVVVGLALSLAQIVALAFRWRLVSRLNGTSVPFPENLRCMLASQFFSQGLPASVGGDALRVWWLVRLDKPMRYALQSVLLDRIAGLVALVVVNTVSVSLLVMSLGGDASAWSIAWIVGGTLLATMVGASRFVRRLMIRLFLALPATLRKRKSVAALMRWLVRFHFTTGQLVFSAQGAVILGWGIAIHLCSVVLCLVVARDAGIGVSFLQLVAVVPPVMLLSYLPLSIGGWGLREGAMALALGMIGFPKEDGVFLGLALGSISLGAALLGALVWLFSPMPISLFGKPRGGAAVSLETETGKAR
jgi:uncharacterized protein (TIRG00374 family)